MRWFVLLFLSVSAWAQIITGEAAIKGSMQVRVGTGPLVVVPTIATLPQVWANDKECGTSTTSYDQTKNIPADYPDMQTAWAAWQADGVDDSWKVIVPATSVNGPLTALAKLVGGNMPTKCIVFDSSAPLTANRTVCAHGIQDNVASSTDPGLRNPDCNGSNMTYQLGQSLISIPAGAFTLANGTSTNTSAYNDVASMYVVECNTSNCAALSSGPVDANGNGPNHFAFFNAEFRVNSSKTCCFPVQLQNAGSTVASLPSHYHFDRVWIHGDATDAGAGSQSLTDAIRLNCGGNCSLSNSQYSKIIRPGAEGHGIYWSDTQQLKVVHNWGEGASINIFDGGLTSSVPGGVSGRDVEIRRNRFTYPLPWLGHGSGAGSVCGVSVSCVRKNCTEMKGAQRYIYDGNICENVDNSGGQNGTLSDWNNRACSGAICDNYAQTIQNITVTNNIYRHGCGGVLFDANSGNPGTSGNSASTPGRNFYLANVLMYDISLINFGCGVLTNGTFYFGGANHDFPVTSVTRDPTGTFSTIVLTGGTGDNQTGLVTGDPITLTTCTDATFNVGPHPYVYALSVSGTTITYPNVGTPNATSSNCVFNNGAGWPINVMANHVTAVGDRDIYVGNNLTAPNATFPRNITYMNSIFTGTRGFGNGGGTEGTSFQTGYFDTTTMLVHHTLYGQRVAPVWQVGTVYKLGQVVQPSGSPAHFYTAVKSGTSGGSQPAFPSTQNSCVTDNTVTWQENGFRISQTGGLPNYTQYSVLNTPISPPTSLYFPQTDFTYGATPDATSIGFSGALNSPTTGSNSCVSGTQVAGINTALDLLDYHGYALASTSTYRHLANDGNDLGVSISALDAAQTSTQYVCGSPCGSGPTPD